MKSYTHFIIFITCLKKLVYKCLLLIISNNVCNKVVTNKVDQITKAKTTKIHIGRNK